MRHRSMPSDVFVRRGPDGLTHFFADLELSQQRQALKPWMRRCDAEFFFENAVSLPLDDTVTCFVCLTKGAH